MKLDLTAVYFNGETITDGNTASWGTALGQERQDYQITIDGAREIIDAMNNPLNEPSKVRLWVVLIQKSQ